MKSIVCHEFPKGMGQLKDENLTAHCEIAEIVSNVELWTSFWNTRIAFFKNIWIIKSC